MANRTEAILHNKKIGDIRLLKDVATFQRSTQITGTIKIIFPVSWTNTKMSMTIRGYNYSYGGAWELKLTGYNQSGWPSGVSALLITDQVNLPFTRVGFGHDGSKCCILLGTTSTVWRYAHIVISEVELSYYGVDSISADNWKIELITDETGITVSSTPTLMQTMTAPATGTQWFDLVLQNGFTSIGFPAQYCKIGNIVFVQAELIHSDGTIPASAIIATLPSGFKPYNLSRFTVPIGDRGIGRLTVHTNGTVVLSDVPPSYSLASLSICFAI